MGFFLDGYYHCRGAAGAVYPPCPGGISSNSDCTPYGIPSYGCFSCPSNGIGDLWGCMPDGSWNLTLFDCTP